MRQASTFAPFDAHGGATGWRGSAFGALEGAAFALPVSLGSVTLVFSRIGPEALSAAVLATLLALAWVHLATVRSQRPVLYAARFFEATTLAAMLDQLIPRLADWSLPDTPGVRLALLLTIGTGAGVWMGVLYLVKADRFSRYIPSPVFAGFATSIAVVLVLSQVKALGGMLGNGDALAVVSTAAAVLAVAFAVRWWAPRWPAAAMALVVGLLVGVAWHAGGHPLPMLGEKGFETDVPWLLADFAALRAPGVAHDAMAWVLAGHAAVLGTTMFINTALASQMLSHADGRRPAGRAGQAWSAAWVTAAGAIGSAPLSGSVQSAFAATRHGPVRAATLAFTALIMAVVVLSGVVSWVPLAAVAGSLLCEAWFMVDRPSLASLRAWLARRPLAGHAREDLALVAAVTVTAVVANMIAAVFAGLALGLLMFAARSARRPVRRVLSGAAMSSNCARGRADLRVLGEYGERLRVLELERDLFFGAVDSLDRTLAEELDRAECIVLDWSAVRHLDSSAAQAVAKFERAALVVDVPVLHVDPDMASEAHAALSQYLPSRRTAPDLDHALEQAENRLLALHAASARADSTAMLESASLLQGLGEAHRARVEALMKQRIVRRGEPLVTAGEASTELLLVLQGSASVLLPHPDGTRFRVAGVRRGATIGEMGFLDGSLRSATVVAEEDTLVAVLTREAFDALGRDDPLLARQILTNIAMDVAMRLRHANRLAAIRHGRH